MRTIPIEWVQPDDILGESLYSVDGVMLTKKGTLLTEALITKIIQNGFQMVYIEDEHSTTNIDSLINHNTFNKATMLIKKIYLAAGHRNSKGDLISESIMDFYFPLAALIDDLLDELRLFKDRPLEYTNIKSVDNYLYMSSLNCGLLSALIAMDLDYYPEMVRNVFMAGVFHDIGMAMIPEEIFHKKEALTMEEKMMILNHPRLGHEFLKDKAFLSAHVKQATLQHHERLNGTGYPNRVPASELSEVSQIIGMTDVYDALTSDRPYSRATTPHEALEFLMGSAGVHYDPRIVQRFTNRINPYPPGTLVELSNGQKAVIDGFNSHFPLRPKLRLISGSVGNYQYEAVDLLEANNLTIKGVIHRLETL